MKYLILFSTLAFVGCTTAKKHILSAGLVSMTERGQEVSGLKENGPVEARYCYGEDSVSSHDNNVGLIDEVVLRAQQDSKARYIKNAQFYSQVSCLLLEGTILK